MQAKNGLENLYSKISNLGKKIGKVNTEWKDKFSSSINDDLNMPQAMAILNEMLKSDLPLADKLATSLDFDKVLGLSLKSEIRKKIRDEKIPVEIQDILNDRENARKSKNWAKSDELRDKLLTLGYEVKDTADGQKLIKK